MSEYLSYAVDPSADTEGMCREGQIVATHDDLVRVLGPSSILDPDVTGDGRTTFQWRIKGTWVARPGAPMALCLYEHKGTSNYDHGLPSPVEFVSLPYAWGITAESHHEATRFAVWLGHKLCENTAADLAEVRGELKKLKLADARRIVAMIDYVVAEGLCGELDDEHDPEYEGYYCGDPGQCGYCDLARAVKTVSPDDEYAARELL